MAIQKVNSKVHVYTSSNYNALCELSYILYYHTKITHELLQTSLLLIIKLYDRNVYLVIVQSCPSFHSLS